MNGLRSKRVKSADEPAEVNASGTIETGQFVVLFPTTGHDLSDRFVKSLFELERYDRGRGYNLFYNFVPDETGCNISRGRNSLCEYMLTETECEYALFIDTDMVYEPDVPYRLIAASKALNIPIMGALCVIVPTSSAPIPTLYRHDDETVTQVAYDYPDNTVVEVAATGTGFLLIHRSVLQKMKDEAGGSKNAWFYEEPHRLSKTGQAMWMGEDISFCLRAGELGFRIAVDTTTPVGHHKGEKVWWPEDARRLDNHPNVVVMLDPTVEDARTVVEEGGTLEVVIVTQDESKYGDLPAYVIESPPNTTGDVMINSGIERVLAHTASANVVLTDRPEFQGMIPALAHQLRKKPRTTAVVCGETIMVKGEWFSQGWRFEGGDGSDILDNIKAAGGEVETYELNR